jgi:hypothetical protein
VSRTETPPLSPLTTRGPLLTLPNFLLIGCNKLTKHAPFANFQGSGTLPIGQPWRFVADTLVTLGLTVDVLPGVISGVWGGLVRFAGSASASWAQALAMLLMSEFQSEAHFPLVNLAPLRISRRPCNLGLRPFVGFSGL